MKSKLWLVFILLVMLSFNTAEAADTTPPQIIPSIESGYLIEEPTTVTLTLDEQGTIEYAIDGQDNFFISDTTIENNSVTFTLDRTNTPIRITAKATDLACNTTPLLYGGAPPYVFDYAYDKPVNLNTEELPIGDDCYKIETSGNYIIYLKGTDRELYLYNLLTKENRLITKNASVDIDFSGNKVIWYDGSNSHVSETYIKIYDIEKDTVNLVTTISKNDYVFDLMTDGRFIYYRLYDNTNDWDKHMVYDTLHPELGTISYGVRMEGEHISSIYNGNIVKIKTIYGMYDYHPQISIINLVTGKETIIIDKSDPKIRKNCFAFLTKDYIAIRSQSFEGTDWTYYAEIIDLRNGENIYTLTLDNIKPNGIGDIKDFIGHYLLYNKKGINMVYDVEQDKHFSLAVGYEGSDYAAASDTGVFVVSSINRDSLIIENFPFETTNPVVISHTPIDNATNVDVLSLGTLEFSEEIEYGSIAKAKLLENGIEVPFDYAYDFEQNKMVFKKYNEEFKSNSHYILSFDNSTTDKMGNRLTPLSFSFDTGLLPSRAVLDEDSNYVFSQIFHPSLVASDTIDASDDSVTGENVNIDYILPWDFPFYGSNFGSLGIHINGQIYLPPVAYSGSCEIFDGSVKFISALNRTLKSTNYGDGVKVQHKTDPERIIVHWSGEIGCDTGSNIIQKFETVIYPNGYIIMRYNDMPIPNFTWGDNVGVSNDDGDYHNFAQVVGDTYNLDGKAFIYEPKFDISLDSDQDGILNSVENDLGTNPNIADENANGMIDAWDYYLLGVVPISIDAEPPLLTPSHTSGIYMNEIEFDIAADEEATIYCTFDGSEPTEDDIFVGTQSLTNGDYTIKYFAKDTYGNTSEVQTINITIDSLEPELTVNQDTQHFQDLLTVILKPNKIGTIRYTTDGSQPTESTSKEIEVNNLNETYSLAFTETTNLKAVLLDKSGRSSEIIDKTYTKYVVLDLDKIDTQANIKLMETKDHWVEDIIQELSDTDLIRGYAEGKGHYVFNPNTKITRSEFVTLMVRALKYNSATNNDPTYQEEVSAQLKEALTKALKVIQDNSEKNTKANDQITEAEMLFIFSQVAEILDLEVHSSYAVVMEEDIPEWATEYVSKAAELELIVNDEQSTYKETSRGEMAVILYNLLTVKL